MRILEFEKLFQSEDTLDKALEFLEEDVSRVDYWAKCMKDNITSNPEEAKNCLNELTGIYSNLRTALTIAETEKKNREIRAYNEIRIESGKAGTKFVATSADKQASGEVVAYRRIRNIILGYKEACQTSVSSIQSLLKYMAVEYNNKGE